MKVIGVFKCLLQFKLHKKAYLYVLYSSIDDIIYEI